MSGSKKYCDTLLGEALEYLIRTFQEAKKMDDLPKSLYVTIGRIISEIWSIRNVLYEIEPSIKRDFVLEYEDDSQRFKRLDDIFNEAVLLEKKGEIEAARRLFSELHNKADFGYFKLLAEAGLYRTKPY